MNTYIVKVLVQKHDGREWVSNTIVKASCWGDALIEAELKAIDLSRCDQKVTSLESGYILECGGGCRW